METSRGTVYHRPVHALRDGLSIAGLIVVVWFFVFLDADARGFDAFACWDVSLDDLYGRSMGQLTDLGAFRYSPPIGILMASFHVLPFEAFYWLWAVFLSASLVWVSRSWSLALCALVAVPISIYLGNIDIPVAAAIVLGMRYPAVWSIPILIRVTPGVGLLWFVVRREWRSLAVALGTTLLIAVPTMIVRPDLWAGFISMLIDNAGQDPHGFPIPLWLRALASVAITIWAGRTSRPWAVAIAMTLIQPSFSIRSAAVGVAAVPLWRARTWSQATSLPGPSGRRGQATRG